MEDRVAPQDSRRQSVGVKWPRAPLYTNSGTRQGCDHDRLCSPTEGDRDKEGWEGAVRGRQAEKKEVERKGAASVAQQMMTFLGNVPYR